jgi:hypothetical protein
MCAFIVRELLVLTALACFILSIVLWAILLAG